MPFIRLRKFPFIASVLGVFIVKGYWILWDVFSVSIQMIICFLSFFLLIGYITLIDFWILNQPCIPGINVTWSEYIILFICWCIPFASILWVFLHIIGIMNIYIHKRDWSVVLFPCDVFIWFWLSLSSNGSESVEQERLIIFSPPVLTASGGKGQTLNPSPDSVSRGTSGVDQPCW